ncbi:mg275 protein [Tupanvirus deep ocean]|uniref:Mg275 protein n=2 Tax=Tupanvirus TaxID=2094720 RepID=A0AC62AAC7_9VIRU|nr:mg275 protein [Tupanvirus deep ocean]QKU34605.1 mg275 protein [Tupanvirus deep ocean]
MSNVSEETHIEVNDCCSDNEHTKDAYVLEDDMTFPKATVDPKLLKLQKEVTEFVTSVILKHENEFYKLIDKHFKNRKDAILGTTCSSIIQMITETTNKFYNKIYYEIQHKQDTPLSNVILEMCEYSEYGAHVLLEKLLRLTLDAHIEVNREQLVLQNNDYSLYEKSVLNQINVYLLSKNLLHVLSKGPDDSGPFIDIPEGKKAFDIIIDKNIEI